MTQSTLLVAAATTLLLSGSAVAQTTAGRAQGLPERLFPSAAAAPAEYRVVDSLANAFSFYSTSQDPFRYDPLLNLLAFIKRGNVDQTGGGNALYIRSSTDLGVTWTPAIGPLHDPAATAAARYPSLVVNPTKSTSLSEFFYYFNAPILTGSGGTFGGFITGMVNQSGDAILPATASQGIGTDTWSSDSRNVASADGSTIISFQSIDGNALAIRRLDLNTGTMTETIPEQFAGSVFTPAEPGFRTATTGGIGVDPNGSIYVMAWARTPGTDAALGEENLMAWPLISKSTDNGATWSELVAMPAQVMVDYAASQGFTADQWTTSYGPTGFVMTGADRASMVFAMLNQDTLTETPVNQLVEARYNNGTWNVFKVADLHPSLWWLLDEAAAEPGNQLENEIQLAITADGETLLAKWVDIVGYLYQDDINGDGEGDDTLMTSDVFVATRATNQGTWSAKKNVTESPILDRTTWIPVGTIPNDLTRLPLLSVQTAPSEEDATIFDQMFGGQRILVTRPQLVMVTNVDATTTPNAAPVTGGRSTASRIASIAPNPTSGTAVLTVEVANSGSGVVEIVNSLGNRVATLAEGTLQAGTHSYTLNGIDLPVGAYYVAMKIDGQTVTHPFSVVR